MAPKKKIKNSKSVVKTRSHMVHHHNEGADRLQKRIVLQTERACTILDIGDAESDLPFVPKGPDMPLQVFSWYTLSGNENSDKQVFDSIFSLMAILASPDVELEEEAVFELYMNLIAFVFPELKKSITPTLRQYSYEVGSQPISDRFQELEIEEEFFELEEGEELQVQTLFAMSGLYLILIGKQLNSANYSQWISNRIRTFTQSCGTSPDNPIYTRLQPSSGNCSVIYSMVTSKWEIRREIFRFIKGASKSKGRMATVARSCMVLLAGAELGTFNLTNKYIVIENPILLCWAELAKYAVHLIAAIDKYQKLGEDAPYCKLLYPSNQLPEFNRTGLRVLAAIARDIAIREGQDTLKNYAGVDTSSDLAILINRAQILVKAAGGANTLTTQIVRENFLANTEDNATILEDLRFGAYVDKIKEKGSDEEEEENLAVDGE